MSVNDPCPGSTRPAPLIRDADAASIPVIGHCLGGQLMSKALGGQVTKNPVKEIGWGEAGRGHRPRPALAGDFAGQAGTVFQWHGETFSIPAGASHPLFTNAWCANQAFVKGPISACSATSR